MAGANTMGWAMLLVVVMALYVGKAQGFPCIYDCATEHATEHGGSWYQYLPECGGLCLHYSSVREDEPSPKLQKALELLAQAPEFQQDAKLPSLGRKSFPPSMPPMIVEQLH